MRCAHEDFIACHAAHLFAYVRVEDGAVNLHANRSSEALEGTLILIDVACHAAQLPALQGIACGIGVNQAAARHVHDDGTGLHLCDAAHRQASAQG